MKIGIILIGYNMEEHVAPCLWPWVNWRYIPQSSGHELLICAVNTPFEGFPVEPPDRTREYLQARVALEEINYLITSDVPLKETEARGRALRWLVEQGVDLLVQLDLDEFWTPEQIVAALAFAEANPWTIWFRVCYKQLVFTHNQWLKEPFAPPRIHRTRTGAYRAHSFSGDNDVLYGGIITRDLKPQDQFASMTVPQGTVWVRHDTWTSSPRAKAKTLYQALRWSPPHGAGCSFRWDEERGLVWNEAHFALTGQPVPEVVHE